ncbi:MAG: hypothetical protein HKO10_05445 [Acidimicrobiia bacterium]|nr:hypothetical protein [Acidimicrobiia bacterium]
MEAIEIARKLSGDGRVMPVEADERRFYRVWDGASSRVIKVDRSRRSHDRELAVIESLDGVLGIPFVLDTGQLDDWYWISFADPGAWNLSAMRNADVALRISRTLNQVRELPPNTFPQPVLTNALIQSEFTSVLRQLRPLRGRLRIQKTMMDQLLEVPAPSGSLPRPAHLGNKATQTFIDNSGNVTLMGWEDGGIAPPEWDFTQVLMGLEDGSRAGAVFAKASDIDPGPIEIHRWIIFHTVRELLTLANNYETATAAEYLVERMKRSLRVAVLDKKTA